MDDMSAYVCLFVFVVLGLVHQLLLLLQLRGALVEL